MIALVRNCAHGSEVATYVVNDDKGRRFVKVALTPEGRAALRSEVEGWTWYQSVRCPARPSMCRTLRDDRHVLRIEIEAIEGRQGRAASGVRANTSLIAAAIEQYCTLWPASAAGTAPLHGDLSCDNLIETTGGLFIIDWEHFQSGAVPWGFDAVYLLFESLYFDIACDGTYGALEIDVIAQGLKQLNRCRPLRSEMQTAPLAFTRQFIRASGHLWRGELTRYPLKLPIVQLSDEQVRDIDLAVRRAIERS